MKLILGFDPETTGIPFWKERSGLDKQPHLVSLAALLINEDTREEVDKLDVIIKPDGWTWDDKNEAFKVHGITVERAMDEGIPEKEALDMFFNLWAWRKRIAFNITFDNRIIRIASKRYSQKPMIDDWKAGTYECAMALARKVMGGKKPKLVDAYQHFMGKELVDAHNAMADTVACMDVYFAAKDHLDALEGRE